MRRNNYDYCRYSVKGTLIVKKLLVSGHQINFICVFA